MSKNRHAPGAVLRKLLNRAKNAPKAYSPEWDATEVQRKIISGEIGPERMCDTKARFARYDHAEKAAGDLRAKHGDELLPYPCPFCAGFHLRTVHGQANG